MCTLAQSTILVLYYPQHSYRRHEDLEMHAASTKLD